MFYISSKSSNGLLGITDSSDNVEEFYSVDEIAKLIKSNKLDIWGFGNSSNAFQDSFIVDINKFLV